MKTLIDAMDMLYQIPANDLELIRSALVSRGKRKGLLMKSAPSATNKPVANAIWNALISNVAPVRVQVCNLMWLKDDIKPIYDRIDKYFSPNTRNYHILNTFGQLPFEFNLYANRYDLEKIEQIILDDIKNKGQ